MDDFYIDERFSADCNHINSCYNCKRYSDKMWTTSTHRLLSCRRFLCRRCAFGNNIPEINPNYTGPFSLHENPSCHTLGNVFKCPRGTCSKQNLTFKEFYNKNCCDVKTERLELKEYNDAKKIDHDYIANIVQVHKNHESLHEQAKDKYEKAKKIFEEAKEEMDNSEAELKNIEDKMALYFVRTATAITQGKPVEEPRLLCTICCEKYNETDRNYCVLLCRHSFCEKCLTAFPNKTCPVCRKSFTADQIIKPCN